MKRKLFPILATLLILTVALLPAIALADSWKYYIEITVKDTSGSIRAGVPVLVSISGQSLIDAGYISDNATNTNLKEGATERNYSIATTIMALFIPSLAADQERSYRLYTGYSPTTDNLSIIVGASGNVTILDAAAIEFGNNFEIEQRGWIDTSAGSDKNLAHKQSAFRTYVSAGGSITSYTSIQSGTLNLQVAAGADDCYRVSDVGGTPEEIFDATGVVFRAGKGHVTDSIKMGTGARFTNITIPQGANIITAYLTVTARANKAVNNVNTKISAEDADNVGDFSGDNVASFDARYANHTTAIVDWNAIGAWTTDTEYNSPEIKTVIQEMIDRGDWDSGDAIVIFWEDFGDDSDVTYRDGYSYEGSSAKAPKLYIEFGDPTNYRTVTATNISSGEHTIKTTADGTNLKIFVDGVEKDSTALGGASVPNNANNWIIMQNDCLPLMAYMTIDVGGVEKLRYLPDSIISGTTLEDETGTNDGTIAWGNNSNLTVTIGETISYASTTSAAGEEIISDTVTTAEQPAKWYGAGGTISNLPFYNTFNDAATNLGMTTQTLYTFMMLGTASAVGLGALLFTGSALIATLIAALAIGAAVSTTVLGGWMVYAFAILAMCILYLAKQY